MSKAKTTGVKTSVGGSTNRIDEEFEYGDRRIFVLDVTCIADGTVKGPNGPLHDQKFTALDFFALDEERGDVLRRSLNAERRRQDNASRGEEPFPGFEIDDGIEVITDSDGTVLTPEEVAAIRGEQIRNDEILEATAWVLSAFPAVTKPDAPIEIIEAAIQNYVMTPRQADFLSLYESETMNRPEVIELYQLNYDAAVARLKDIEPWEGYATASISASVENLMKWRETLSDNEWEDLLFHIRLYEPAHRDRNGIRDFLADQAIEDSSDEPEDDEPQTGETFEDLTPVEPPSPELDGEEGA